MGACHSQDSTEPEQDVPEMVENVNNRASISYASSLATQYDLLTSEHLQEWFGLTPVPELTAGLLKAFEKGIAILRTTDFQFELPSL